MENENVKIFNKLSESYENCWNKDKKGKKRIEKIVKKIGLKNGMKVVEPGCGRGEFTPFILKKIGKSGVVYAIDFSDKMLKHAKENLKNHKNVKFYNCCASNMPVKDNEIDAVVAFNSFPHFFPKEKFIREFYRALKDNGLLIITHDLPGEKINVIHENAGFNMKKNFLPDRREMFKMLMKNGFAIKKYENRGHYFLKAIKNGDYKSGR
jgi:ubiquinone/menaquinone biosynthesis C-methylase UbiE